MGIASIAAASCTPAAGPSAADRTAGDGDENAGCRLDEQAAALERLFPEIHRRLFALEPGHPVTEMPLPQLRVFVMLGDGPLPLSVIGRGLGISPSTVTQVADRLERAGLVERVAQAGDRRVKRLQLTARGEGLARERRSRRVARVREALSRLPDGCREDILHSLKALVEASAQAPARASYRDPTGERTRN